MLYAYTIIYSLWCTDLMAHNYSLYFTVAYSLCHQVDSFLCAFNVPRCMAGGRHLHGPLHRIMTDESDSRPAVILVLLSDLPNDADKVHKLLLSFTAATSATKKRVTVSFVQVGGKAAMSASLDAWMKLLSTEKTLKSIVDVTTCPSLRDAWFSDVLAKHF